MRCASALSTARNSDAAIREVLDRIAAGLDSTTADLLVVFSSPHHADVLDQLAETARARGLARHVVGCTGESIVGDDREIEGATALSAWAVALPDGTTVHPLRLTHDGQSFHGWPDDLNDVDAEANARRALIALAEPFSFPADLWLKSLNADAPGLRIVGGMASAGQVPGQNRLLLDGQTFADGLVGVLIDGPVAVRTVVSQGCRPIGRLMLVTRADQNLVRELGRRPALEVLRETFEELDEADRDLVREGLHLGRVINEYQESFGRGDFLVRNVIGADDSGALAVGDFLRVGQTVQFHVRDADTADEDLASLLNVVAAATQPAGALLFTCNGRGSRLFSRPDHDVDAIRAALGPIPVAGFFAMGEIGPIGGQNFLHGFTASVALFEERTP